MALYLTAIYIILFLFLECYTFIFADIYGFSEGKTNLVCIAMIVGTILVAAQVPIIWSWTLVKYKQSSRIRPETRLWYAMLRGAPAIPISLFWMAWTSYSSISVWSPMRVGPVWLRHHNHLRQFSFVCHRLL